MLSWFFKLPHWLIEFWLYLCVPIFMLIRWMLGSVYGILIVVLGLYIYRFAWAEVAPFTFGELLMWIDAQSPDTITSLAASLITVVGFLIAFSTADASWKRQAFFSMQDRAATEIEVQYSEIIDLLISTKIFCESLVELVHSSDSQTDAETERKIAAMLPAMDQFDAERERLNELRSSVWNLSVRFNAVLVRSWGSREMLDHCHARLGKTVHRIWFSLPSPSLVRMWREGNTARRFLGYTNIAECKAYIEDAEQTILFLSARVWGISGFLRKDVAAASLQHIVFLLGKRKELRSARGTEDPYK